MITIMQAYEALVHTLSVKHAPSLATIDDWTQEQVDEAYAYCCDPRRPVPTHIAPNVNALAESYGKTSPTFHARVDHEEMMAGENFVTIEKDWRFP